MSSFISQATRARHEYFDKTMSEAETMLHDPAVVTALGQEALNDYKYIFDCYYVPNIRQNTVQIPDTDPRSEKGIPVIPVTEGDTFIFPGRVKPFHPIQVGYIENILLDWGFSESRARSMGRELTDTYLRRPLKVGFDAEEYGSVQAINANPVFRHPQWDNPVPVQVFGAPSVALNMETTEGELEEALTLVHETEHVYQHLVEPIVHDDEEFTGQYQHIKEREALELEDSVQRALSTESKNAKYGSWTRLEEARRFAKFVRVEI